MKTRTLLAATLAATLALAGCSKNDEPDGPTRAAVNIRTSIGGTIDAGNFGSRAAISADGSGNFEAGDVLGLYATVGATAKLANSAYTVGSTALWWDELSMTDPVAFAAYYPKAEAITDPAATIFNAATATNPDLLLATPVTASKGEDIALAFRHAMHRLTVNLSTDIDGWDIATAQVSLAGMNASATVNITAGTVTPSEADATDGDYGTKTGAAATFVVAPQKVTTNADWIQITMDGEQYVYKVPANITLPGGTTAPLTALESGKTLTLNLALTRDGVTLTTGDIAAWDTQGTIDGEINIGGGDTPIDGNIDMTDMTADQVKAAIDAAIAAGITEFKLTGPIANLGIKEDYTQSTGNPFYNTGVTKVDLSGVTGWQTVTYSNFPDVTSSVAGLPAYTFYGCAALTEVVLPAEVKAIGLGAFLSCTSLSTINLKDVTHIGKQAFGFCEALTVVDLSAVINLYMEAFQETGLTALSLPEALAISGGLTANNFSSHTGSFGDCESLVSVNAPKLTSTGYKSFSGCSALTTLTLSALTEINDEAFYSCKKLTTENEGFGFAKEVTTVGEKAFGYCTGLTNPELPGATLINSYAFTGCTAMESLKLPKATRFGAYIANRCKSLTRIEATASGALTLSDGGSLDNGAVFGNQGTTGDLFDAANCTLVLNADKNTGGTGSPTVNGTTWANATWKSITNP